MLSTWAPLVRNNKRVMHPSSGEGPIQSLGPIEPPPEPEISERWRRLILGCSRSGRNDQVYLVPKGRLRFSSPMERDGHFIADEALSAYTEEAFKPSG